MQRRPRHDRRRPAVRDLLCALRCRRHRRVHRTVAVEPDSVGGDRIFGRARTSRSERGFARRRRLVADRALANPFVGHVEPRRRSAFGDLSFRLGLGFPAGVAVFGRLSAQISRSLRAQVFQCSLSRAVCVGRAGVDRRRCRRLFDRMGSDVDRELSPGHLRVRARRKLARRLRHAGDERGRDHRGGDRFPPRCKRAGSLEFAGLRAMSPTLGEWTR